MRSKESERIWRSAPWSNVSLTGQTFPKRHCVRRRAKQQDRVVGGGDAIRHDQRVEVDWLAGHAFLLRRRLGDREGAGREMFATLGPRQRRVVQRIAGLADVDDHV